MSTITATSLSDLTPAQGQALDRLPPNWEVIGRVDSELSFADMCDPNPYSDPPMLVLVRDQHGHEWQIGRDGNLNEFADD